jgi:EAL domain-containing protein (putative c-di-GMP-specific phosphodiesterase class I)
MNASTLQRMTLENSLRQAMEQNEFLVHYQPLIDLKSGQVVGAEALLRWRHPEMDMVSPSVFIELAEESGVIIPLGEWMIGVVCRQIHTWQQEGTRIIPISVNISLRQFQQSDLPQKIEALLKDNNVDPFFLEIELTESTVMQDVDAAAKMLQRVKKRGIRLAIDDFGTGYSSLVHLKRFHIDKLKIDQSLVRELVDNADDSAIVRAIISMAHNLRLVVVAEGVETRKQLDFLKVLHCDQIQGYFFSEALPAESFASLLREGKALSA